MEILFHVVVTILKYRNNTFYHAICIKVFSNVTVSYPIVSTYYVINTTNDRVQDSYEEQDF